MCEIKAEHTGQTISKFYQGPAERQGTERYVNGKKEINKKEYSEELFKGFSKEHCQGFSKQGG